VLCYGERGVAVSVVLSATPDTERGGFAEGEDREWRWPGHSGESAVEGSVAYHRCRRCCGECDREEYDSVGWLVRIRRRLKFGDASKR
jgi:hypothetical protein